jgi:hypothetical protein
MLRIMGMAMSSSKNLSLRMKRICHDRRSTKLGRGIDVFAVTGNRRFDLGYGRARLLRAERLHGDEIEHRPWSPFPQGTLPDADRGFRTKKSGDESAKSNDPLTRSFQFPLQLPSTAPFPGRFALARTPWIFAGAPQ